MILEESSSFCFNYQCPKAAVAFVSLLLIFDDILQDNLIRVINATILYNFKMFLYEYCHNTLFTDAR